MKGIIIIGLAWALLNLISYLLFGGIGLIFSTYICMTIIWFGKKKISKLLNIK